MTSHSLFDTAAPESLGFVPARLQRIDAMLSDASNRRHLPGAVAMVVRRGKVVLQSSVGMQDANTGTAMSPDSLFRIYSMTKPIVSVAVMMLAEQGRVLLGDPIWKYLPEFTDVQVVSLVDGQPVKHRPRIAPTVQDLLRHTSGLTYEILGTEPVQQLYAQADLWSRKKTNREFSQVLSTLPLMFEPGTTFGYSRATDLLGSLIEAVTGQTLGAFLQQNILDPLGMADTVFHVEPAQQHRIAEPFAVCPDTGAPVELIDIRQPYPMESGGAGLVSTVGDYARFLQCLQNGGELQGHRILMPNTVRNMTTDHLGQMAQHFTQRSGYMLAQGVGFGLGFSVKLQDGLDPQPGSAGLYSWGGIGGTTFFVDPAKELFAILLTQAPNQRDIYRPRFRAMVYAALLD
ncbi:serine hydrolase domain-containing protein [Rhodoferax sp. GW822-FHT02A01]|uniref:serine hydrolase domain-containing protein n=1 Tax=Rhodoferax sp. GW822-FHT02A01 TaxID=3141537 RepID=UPI00315D61E0